MFDGATYFSCEHAYQAAKFSKGSHTRRLIDAARPLPGESDDVFGNRCWELGQTKVDQRPDWEAAKVKMMLDVNRAKYAQHVALQQSLLSTLPAKLEGNTLKPITKKT